MRRASAPMASHACLAKQTGRRRLSEGGSESVCLQSCSRMVDPNAVPHHRGVTRVCSIRSQHQMCVCARTSRGESASAMPCFHEARVASRRAMTRWASQPSVASPVARMAREREASRRQVATTQAEGRQVTRQRHLRPSLTLILTFILILTLTLILIFTQTLTLTLTLTLILTLTFQFYI